MNYFESTLQPKETVVNLVWFETLNSEMRHVLVKTTVCFFELKTSIPGSRAISSAISSSPSLSIPPALTKLPI